ncbi:MAG TPA: alkaline phosphatase family protein, partial [Vicinamibacterales bacterium]|nr:alkaline phosphatase family protein [Vicinamibacterales bacterium]
MDPVLTGDNVTVKRVVIGMVLLCAAAAGWFVWGRESRAPTPGLRANIVLITLDTFRADRLGRGLTPNLDKLAARGVRFTNVRATAPLTLPSH